jgi:superfamily II DNA/RNA helicase
MEASKKQVEEEKKGGDA